MRENIFLCVGSPLVDIIATVDEEFLNTYDLKSNNAVAACAKNIKVFEDLEKFQPCYQAGGCALNTARTFQWILKCPKLSIVVGAVGKDSYCKILKNRLDEELVNYVFEEINGVATGKCAVLLTGDNRSLCTDLGASKYFEIRHLKRKEVWTAIEEAEYYYVPGFFLGVSTECLMEVVKHSVSKGKTFAFNLSAPFLCENYKKEIDDLLPFVDILFGNESEARAFARIHNFKSDVLEEILLFISTFNFNKTELAKSRITVITRGPNPVYLVANNKITNYSIKMGCKVKDTSAAGDAFVGGFMAQFVMKKPLEQCILSGISTAGKVIENIGCSLY